MTSSRFAIAAWLLGSVGLVACFACGDKPDPEPTVPHQPSPSPSPPNPSVQATQQAPADAPALPPGHPPTGATAPSGRSDAPPTAPAGPPRAGGLTWDAEAPLSATTPSSSMRAAQYAVAGEAGEAELTVYYFGPGQGGSVQANLDRWIGQIKQPDGRPSKQVAKIAERKVDGLKVTTLDVSGTFDGGMAPMMGGKAEPQTDHRMLGAIAEGPEGPVFFKLVGPRGTVESAESAFEKLVESLEPAG